MKNYRGINITIPEFEKLDFIYVVYPGKTLLEFINKSPRERAIKIKEIFESHICNDKLSKAGYNAIREEIRQNHPYLNRIINLLTSRYHVENVLYLEMLYGAYNLYIVSALSYINENLDEQQKQNIISHLVIYENNYDEEHETIMSIFNNTEENHRNYFKLVEIAYDYAVLIINNVFLVPIANDNLKQDKKQIMELYRRRFNLIDILLQKSEFINYSNNRQKKMQLRMSDHYEALIENQINEYDLTQINNSNYKNCYADIDNTYNKLQEIIEKALNSEAYIADDILAAIRIEFFEIIERGIIFYKCDKCNNYYLGIKTCPKCKTNIYTQRHRGKMRIDVSDKGIVINEFQNMLNRNTKQLCSYNKTGNTYNENMAKLCKETSVIIHAIKCYVLTNYIDLKNFFYDPLDEDEDEENTIDENFDEKLEYTKYLNVINTYSFLIRFIKSNLIEIKKYYERTNKNEDKCYLEKALAIALDKKNKKI